MGASTNCASVKNERLGSCVSDVSFYGIGTPIRWLIVSVRLGSPSSLRSSLVGALSKTLAALTERVEQMEGKGHVNVEAERWNRWDGY